MRRTGPGSGLETAESNERFLTSDYPFDISRVEITAKSRAFRSVLVKKK